VNIDQLAQVCRDAARDLARRAPRPLPATVVLPQPNATRVTALPDFPDDDAERRHLLEYFAADVMRPANAPCYGFLAEASLADGSGSVDVVVCAYGARGRGAYVTAAALETGGPGEPPHDLGPFSDPEPLDPDALPFLCPLQKAADAAAP
jgi:hypothetical protein